MNRYDQMIYNVAKPYKLPYSFVKLICAQARLETGNYTSPNFNNLNNLFGYGYVAGNKLQTGKSKDVNAPNEPKNFAKYPTKENSVIELIKWWQRRHKEGFFKTYSEIDTPEKYSDILKKKKYYMADQKLYTSILTKNIPKVSIDPNYVEPEKIADEKKNLT